MCIKRRVSQLVRKYQTRNPFEMIKGMNVILVHYPLEGVRGFYQYFQRNNIIYLDERLSEAEQRFVLAHELGHMFLHKKLMLFLWIHVLSLIQINLNWKQIFSLWSCYFQIRFWMNTEILLLTKYPG